jgi:hypothetical protein
MDVCPTMHAIIFPVVHNILHEPAAKMSQVSGVARMSRRPQYSICTDLLNYIDHALYAATSSHRRQATLLTYAARSRHIDVSHFYADVRRTYSAWSSNWSCSRLDLAFVIATRKRKHISQLSMSRIFKKGNDGDETSRNARVKL